MLGTGELAFGPALVRYRDANGIQDVQISRGNLYRFTFPPKVAHALVLWGRADVSRGVEHRTLDSEHPDALLDRILGADDLAKLI